MFHTAAKDQRGSVARGGQTLHQHAELTLQAPVGVGRGVRGSRVLDICGCHTTHARFVETFGQHLRTPCRNEGALSGGQSYLDYQCLTPWRPFSNQEECQSTALSAKDEDGGFETMPYKRKYGSVESAKSYSRPAISPVCALCSYVDSKVTWTHPRPIVCIYTVYIRHM